VTGRDKQIQAIPTRLKQTAPPPANKLIPARRRTRQPNAPAFDARAALHAILGVDLTQIDGLGPYLALKLVGGVWNQPRGLAEREALHVMVGARAS
jgi:predicted flap endonuclease-1-like 5' DNA nuclease